MNPIVTHIGTACCIIEIAGYKILTDPVLDKAGKYYHHGFGAVSKKITDPAIEESQLSNVDLILLSHPQHKDNFDTKGREFARTIPLILSTKRAEKSFPNAVGLKPWEEYRIDLPNDAYLTITATPAQHHPNWLPEFIAGKVIGFMITYSESAEKLYISGDTVYFKGIEEVFKRFNPITYGLIHVGSAEVRYLTGYGQYTMDASGFIQTINQISPQLAIPIHNDGWSHFNENDAGVKKAIDSENDQTQERVKFLKKGVRTELKLLMPPNDNA